jgi:NADH-quinone oxidoreductase subunit N
MSATPYDTTVQTLLVLLPEFVILAVAIAMMTLGAFVRWPRRVWSRTAAAALGAALVLLLFLHHVETDPYGAAALNDPLSWYARLVAVFTGLVVVALAHDQVDDARAAEFFGALLVIFAGAMVVCAANEIVLLFVGLELVSIPTYLILYLPRRNANTQEAATKYFFLSIFASALSLYGLAFLYGLTGVSNLKALAYLAQALPGIPQPELGLVAAVFIMAGMGFRVAAVPFHFYAPDVYQGSPAVVAALLSWVPKGVGFVAILRVLTTVIGGHSILADKAVVLAWVIAAATLIVGNTVALLQTDLKRLLAYSSIAHAGYLMIGVTVAFHNDASSSTSFLGGQGILFYLTAYALMTLGAFGVVIALDSPERPIVKIDDLSGLGRTHPFAALAMALCMFSLAGVPPMAGFWGKFYIFASAFAVGSEEDTRWFRILAVVGVINAAIGAYYYLRIVVVMYLRPVNERPAQPEPGWPTAVAVMACATLSLVFGLFPQPIARAAREATIAAIAHPDPAPAALVNFPAPPPPGTRPKEALGTATAQAESR